MRLKSLCTISILYGRYHAKHAAYHCQRNDVNCKAGHDKHWYILEATLCLAVTNHSYSEWAKKGCDKDACKRKDLDFFSGYIWTRYRKESYLRGYCLLTFLPCPLGRRPMRSSRENPSFHPATSVWPAATVATTVASRMRTVILKRKWFFVIFRLLYHKYLIGKIKNKFIYPKFLIDNYEE